MGPSLRDTMIAILALAVLALATPPAASRGETGALEAHTDATSDLTTWTWRGEDLSLELAQLLPDQTRAFFQARGFGTEHAERIAGHCVFQAVLRNHGQRAAIEVDLHDWRSHGPEGKSRPRPDRDWQATGSQEELPEAARIAFRWALFPGEHRFEPGDWLMGMVLFDHPPDTPFDLTLRWRMAGEVRQARLPGLRCADDQRE